MSVITHLKNKYPGAQVFSSENAIDVYKDGEHLVALRKNGSGQMLCESERLGAKDTFCLAPIPKDSRVHKVIDGKLGLAEEGEERKSLSKKFQDSNGKVLSCKELESKGWEFCSKQKVVRIPEVVHD